MAQRNESKPRKCESCGLVNHWTAKEVKKHAEKCRGGVFVKRPEG